MSFASKTSAAGHEGADSPSGRTASSPTRRARYHRWKGLIGRILAAVLLVPGLPIIGLLIVLVRLTSPGPGIYRQVRVGLGGKTFAMFKIRTMRNDAEVKSGPAWTQKNDPRVTPVGRVLRKLHLDEFPQLFNVLRGEMALIGPRPERPEFTQVLAREIPDYMDRVLVLPGITGLAQINLPPDTDLDSVRRKLVLDLEYVRTATPMIDVRMMACTLLRMLGLRGDYAMRLMRLQRSVVLQNCKYTSEHINGTPTGHCTPASIAEAALQRAHTSTASSKGQTPAAKPAQGAAPRLLDGLASVNAPVAGNGKALNGKPAANGVALETGCTNGVVGSLAGNEDRLGTR